MSLWFGILLAVDLILMGAILFILAGKRREPRRAARLDGVPAITEELKEIKRIAKSLEKKKQDLDDYERSLDERRERLEELLKATERSAQDLTRASGSVKNDDIYAKAMEMLRKGVPADEIIKSLGLLHGEFDLLASLRNYRG